MKSLFEYMDYRQYLRDFYEEKRAEGKISLRQFSQKAGLTSKSYLARVMDGSRNLSPDTIHGFARALGLKRDEAEFFEYLVLMNQAKTHEEKDRYYQKLSSIDRYLEVRQLERDQYAFLSRWYYAAIREMLLLPNFKLDYDWIARHLRPHITANEAREAVEFLLKAGLVVKEGRGKLCPAEPNMRTGSEVSSIALGNFHVQMLKRAADYVMNSPPAKREFSALTVAIDPSQFEAAKREVQRFRRRLHALTVSGKKPTSVYQFSLVAFPLAEVEDEE